VRIKPDEKEGDLMVKKVSSDGLCVGDEQFKFDEVFDAESNQVVDREIILDSSLVCNCALDLQ